MDDRISWSGDEKLWQEIMLYSHWRCSKGHRNQQKWHKRNVEWIQKSNESLDKLIARFKTAQKCKYCIVVTSSEDDRCNVDDTWFTWLYQGVVSNFNLIVIVEIANQSDLVTCHFTANSCCETFSVCCETFPTCCETFPDCCETFTFCCENFPKNPFAVTWRRSKFSSKSKRV